MKFKSIICGGLCLTSLYGFSQDPETKLDTKPLRVYGDSVKFEASITVPKDKIFKKAGTYVIMPELGETKFEPIRIPSSKLNNAAVNGISVDISASVLFNEDMIGNDLEIEHEYEYMDGRRNVEFKDMDDIAECCITTGMLYSVNGQYELMKYDYTPAKEVPLKVVAQINFPLDIAKFSTDETRKAIKEIGSYLKANPSSTITIKGFASPEGTVARNEELSEQRAIEVKRWLVNELTRNGYGRYFYSDEIRVRNEDEDWNGFRYLMSEANISYEKQNKIFDILNSGKTPAEKEDAVLAELGGLENAEKFLMPLRRTTIVVSSKTAKRKGYSADEIDRYNQMYATGDMTLSAMREVFTNEELLEASQRTNARKGKITLLNSYYKVRPGDIRAYSNLGALKAADLSKFDVVGGDDALVGVGFDRDLVDIDREFDLDEDKLKYKYKYKEEDVDDGKKIKFKMKADLAEAEMLLVKAYHKDRSNFVVLNNLGAHYLTIGEYRKAKQYLDKSVKLNDSQGVNYNLGVYHARMGNHEKALMHFNKSSKVKDIEYNRGIAKLMTNDNAGALRDFQAFTKNNAEYALGHYLTAVAAARVGNKDVIIEELEHAINRNKRLSDISQEDLEFREYWEKEWFEDASDDDFTPSSKIGKN